MTKHPADYIDVTDLDVPARRSIRRDVKDCVRRFHTQIFTADHVVGFLKQCEYYQGRTSLNPSVRRELNDLVRNETIEVVEEGRAWSPNIYRNRSDERQKKQTTD